MLPWDFHRKSEIKSHQRTATYFIIRTLYAWSYIITDSFYRETKNNAINIFVDKCRRKADGCLASYRCVFCNYRTFARSRCRRNEDLGRWLARLLAWRINLPLWRYPMSHCAREMYSSRREGIRCTLASCKRLRSSTPGDHVGKHDHLLRY